MKTILALLTFIALGFLTPADAQTSTDPKTVALVCAYNSGGPPVPINGQYYFVQCDNTGKLITSGGGGGSGTVSPSTPGYIGIYTGSTTIGGVAYLPVGQRKVTGSSDTIATSDAGGLVIYAPSSPASNTYNLPTATGASGSFPNNWNVNVQCQPGASYTCTIAPLSGTVAGAASIALGNNQGGTFVSDGGNWDFIGTFGTSSSVSPTNLVTFCASGCTNTSSPTNYTPTTGAKLIRIHGCGQGGGGGSGSVQVASTGASGGAGGGGGERPLPADFLVSSLPGTPLVVTYTAAANGGAAVAASVATPGNTGSAGNNASVSYSTNVLFKAFGGGGGGPGQSGATNSGGGGGGSIGGAGFTGTTTAGAAGVGGGSGAGGAGSNGGNSTSNWGGAGGGGAGSAGGSFTGGTSYGGAAGGGSGAGLTTAASGSAAGASGGSLIDGNSLINSSGGAANTGTAGGPGANNSNTILIPTGSGGSGGGSYDNNTTSQTAGSGGNGGMCAGAGGGGASRFISGAATSGAGGQGGGPMIAIEEFF